MTSTHSTRWTCRNQSVLVRKSGMPSLKYSPARKAGNQLTWAHRLGPQKHQPEEKESVADQRKPNSKLKHQLCLSLECTIVYPPRTPSPRGNSPRITFSSPRGSKRKTDVLDDLQFSASEKEGEDEEDENDEEFEEVAMDVDVDANYDPEAEFFSSGGPSTSRPANKDENIHDDLQVSESEEEGEIRDDDEPSPSKKNRHHSNRPNSSRDDDDDGGLWF